MFADVVVLGVGLAGFVAVVAGRWVGAWVVFWEGAGDVR
jgi:hypothetical protein